jgi:hypothetical protein
MAEGGEIFGNEIWGRDLHVTFVQTLRDRVTFVQTLWDLLFFSGVYGK